MKNKIVAVMVIQSLLVLLGVYLLFDGEIIVGAILIIFNISFVWKNIRNIKIINIMNYPEPNVKKSKSFYLKPVGQGYWIITNGKYDFSIKDVTIGVMTNDIEVMKFKKSDAEKVKRFLNGYYKGHKFLTHWRVYNRIKKQLNLTTGMYYYTN